MKRAYLKSELTVIQRLGSRLDHTTTEILMIAFFAVAVATLSNLAIHGIKLKTIIAFPVLFVLSAGLMFLFSLILRKIN